MEKTFKNGDIRLMNFAIVEAWENSKKDLKVSGAALYSMISIKRSIQQIGDTIMETIRDITMSHGGEPQQDGNVKIPPDQIEEVNHLINDVLNQEATITFATIKVGENDRVPPDIMDIFFDFIEMT